MNASAFKPGNRFVDWVSISQAAVDWQGLRPEQQRLVVVNDGMPFLAGIPELAERAEALLDAAERRIIQGLTHNEDGFSLRPEAMRLNRTSVQAFTQRIGTPAPVPSPMASEVSDVLLTEEAVRHRLGDISRSTLSRRRSAGEIEQPHAQAPNRWRKSYIDSLVAGRSPEDKEADGI